MITPYHVKLTADNILYPTKAEPSRAWNPKGDRHIVMSQFVSLELVQ
jgi:hypothetical protein